MEHPSKTSIVKAAGLVFGDIGTSPIYTLAVLFLFLTPTPENVMGAVSLVFWTLVIMVTVQYTFLAMRLSETGEGGTLTQGTSSPLLKAQRNSRFHPACNAWHIPYDRRMCNNASHIYPLRGGRNKADTRPEIMSQEWLIFLAILITLGLFLFQKRGTEGVSRTFGPVMAVWFLVLFTSGAISVSLSPEILFAINPLYAVQFFVHNGIQGFVSLSMIVLCATGAEALFADMGHLGREPIQYAWGFVFVAVLFSYMGQAAHLLRNPGVGNPLFEMVFSISHDIYIPFLILMIIATVIASQSVISGIFSIIYQAITTHLLPMLPVDYTSDELRTQIYINTINWLLCVAVICVLLIFQFSDRLASAYGLSVTATMSITGSFMVAIFFHRQKYIYMGIAVIVTMVDILSS